MAYIKKTGLQDYMSFSSYFYTIYYNDTKYFLFACILHTCRDFWE